MGKMIRHYRRHLCPLGESVQIHANDKLTTSVEPQTVASLDCSPHVPDVKTWYGLRDLVLFSIIHELGKLLYSPDDEQPITPTVHANLIQNRKSARTVIKYVDMNLELQYDRKKYSVFGHLFLPYLAQVARVIVDFREQQGIHSAPLREELLMTYAPEELLGAYGVEETDFQRLYDEAEAKTFSWQREFVVIERVVDGAGRECYIISVFEADLNLFQLSA